MAQTPLTEAQALKYKKLSEVPDAELTPEQMQKRTERRENMKSVASKRGFASAPPTQQPLAAVPVLSNAHKDYTDEPIIFFKHGSRWADFGHTNNKGIVVIPPHEDNKVEFQPFFRQVVPCKDGKGDEAKCACKFQTHSIKLIEYYRSHPQYGITIFENLNNLDKIDSSIADIMGEMARQLVGLTDTDLIAKAKGFGIPISHDLGLVRNRILEKMALNEFDRRRKNQQKAAESVKFAKGEEGEPAVAANAY